jgi:hypothetical protein
MLRSDEYGNSYDDGQPDPNAVDPSQQYITTYTNDEFGNRFPQLVENPNYDIQRYDPKEYQRRVDHAATQRGGGGLAGFLSRGPLKRIGDAISEPVRQVSEEFYDATSKYAIPAALAALTYGAGSALAPAIFGATSGSTAAGALGELGINTALTAGSPGAIAAGTTIGELGGYTPELLHAAQGYLNKPGNLANLAKQGYGAYKTITGGAKPAPRAGQAPTGGGGFFMPPEPLDTTAESLTGGGGGYDGGLQQVYRQMSDRGAVPMMSASNQQVESPQEAFEYQTFKDGGSALSQVLKETFSEKNLFPQFKDLDDRPVLLTSQNPGIKAELAKLKRIKNVGGLAQGGLPQKYAAAAPHGHRPEFITGITGHYACGKGTGQSDDIPAMLHDGDYVMDAETVSALGDGSSKAGKEVLESFHKRISYKRGGQAKPVPAKIADGEYVFDEGFVTALGGGDNKRGSQILDGLREKLRAHKRGAPVNKIPPKAKDPAAYIGKGK